MKAIVAMLLCGLILAGQAMAQTQQSPAADTPQRLDPAKQMEQDLNQMESLLNNMAAETAFIKDTNLSILLNSNYRMWSILLRDLRLQMELQKQRDAKAPATTTTH